MSNVDNSSSFIEYSARPLMRNNLCNLIGNVTASSAKELYKNREYSYSRFCEGLARKLCMLYNMMSSLKPFIALDAKEKAKVRKSIILINLFILMLLL